MFSKRSGGALRCIITSHLHSFRRGMQVQVQVQGTPGACTARRHAVLRKYNQRVCARAQTCAVAATSVDPGLLEARHRVGAHGGGAHRAVQLAEVL